MLSVFPEAQVCVFLTVEANKHHQKNRLVFNRNTNHSCITCRYPVSVTVCWAEQQASYSLFAEPGVHTPYLSPHLSSTYISTQLSIEVVGNTVCRRSQMCIHACRRRALNNFLKTRRCWEDSFAWKLLWRLSPLVLPNYFFSTRCKGLVFNAISDWHIDSNGFASHLGHIYRDADKSLARPGKKQATATEDFEFHISYL
jgi:hypothetical protein